MDLSSGEQATARPCAASGRIGTAASWLESDPGWPAHADTGVVSPPACALRCKRGHPSGALMLKPCKFAVQPVCDRSRSTVR